MTQQLEIGHYEIFDQTDYTHPEHDIESESRAIGQTILDISQLSIDFASIERVPRYYHDRKENDAEHSFMLGLASMEIGNRYFPGLDVGLMAQFALVHDLVELETADTPTFSLSEEQQTAKHHAEQKALQTLVEILPSHIADMLVWYEEQTQPEARLVRHIDKLLPYAVNTTGAGISVMHEDYNVTSVGQLMEAIEQQETRFLKMFPESEHDILRKAHTVLANRFALEFSEA